MAHLRAAVCWVEPTSQACQLREFLERRPPTRKAQVRALCAWNGLHGVGRGYSDCGCNSGGQPLVQTRFDESARWFVLEHGSATVACNFANRTQCVRLRDGKHTIPLASDLLIEVVSGRPNLPPDTMAILKA